MLSYYNLYNVERVTESNHGQDFIVIVFSDYDYKHDDMVFRARGVIDDISLMNRSFEKNGREKNILGVGILQLLCREKLYKREVAQEDREDITKNEKKTILLI